jgi:serine/threonine protein kinase
VCASSARTGPCGGQRVTAVPTATARDTKLKRDVALKVLPDSFANDPERMARFQREAEVLASLNHPNIAQIYGVEERALAMELVEGEAPKGPMPFDDAWKKPHFSRALPVNCFQLPSMRSQFMEISSPS